MTLLRVESFGHYGPTTAAAPNVPFDDPNNKFYVQHARKWAQAGLPLGESPQGRIISGAPTGSGKAFQFSKITATSSLAQDRLIINTPYDSGDPTQTFFLGFRFRVSAFQAVPIDFLRFFSSVSSPFLAPDGRVLLGSAGEIILADAAGNLMDTLLQTDTDTWNYMEIRFTRHPSAGVMQARFNGEPSALFTGLNTRASAGASVPGQSNIMFQNNQQIAPGIGDLYLADDRGSVNNDFIGDILVVPTLPTVDVLKEFTPSAGGDNFAMVDDPQPAGPDEDATTNTTTVPGSTDLFRGNGTGFVSGYRVIGIQGIVRARKLNSGIAVMRSVIGSGSGPTTEEGRDHFLSTSYRYHPHVFELNPVTASPFTISEANNVVFGYTLVDLAEL